MTPLGETASTSFTVRPQSAQVITRLGRPVGFKTNLEPIDSLVLSKKKIRNAALNVLGTTATIAVANTIPYTGLYLYLKKKAPAELEAQAAKTLAGKGFHNLSAVHRFLVKPIVPLAFGASAVLLLLGSNMPNWLQDRLRNRNNG